MNKSNQVKKAKPMSKSTQAKNKSVLSDDMNAEIAVNIMPTIPAPEVALRIKTKLMQRVQSDAHQFLFANQGEWKSVYDGVEIKLLRMEGEKKSFLIKMAANSSIPAHMHAHDEESFVIEGSVIIEGIHCQTGDYHYAMAGSQHQTIKSVEGCSILIKTI